MFGNTNRTVVCLVEIIYIPVAKVTDKQIIQHHVVVFLGLVFSGFDTEEPGECVRSILFGVELAFKTLGFCKGTHVGLGGGRRDLGWVGKFHCRVVRMPQGDHDEQLSKLASNPFEMSVKVVWQPLRNDLDVRTMVGPNERYLGKIWSLDVRMILFVDSTSGCN